VFAAGCFAVTSIIIRIILSFISFIYLARKQEIILPSPPPSRSLSNHQHLACAQSPEPRAQSPETETVSPTHIRQSWVACPCMDFSDNIHPKTTTTSFVTSPASVRVQANPQLQRNTQIFAPNDDTRHFTSKNDPCLTILHVHQNLHPHIQDIRSIVRCSLTSERRRRRRTRRRRTIGGGVPCTYNPPTRQGKILSSINSLLHRTIAVSRIGCAPQKKKQNEHRHQPRPSNALAILPALSHPA
jgi:hypothetical protein